MTSAKGDDVEDVLQRDSSVPLYAQLEAILRAKIASGEWAPNRRIPSENELNRIYGLSRMTARGVLTTLVNEGLLFRVQGKGTYVAPPKINTVSPAYRGVREQLEAMGYETTTELVEIGIGDVPESVRSRLKVGPDDDVFHIHRVRSVQGEPISSHHSFVPAALAPGLPDRDVVTEQLCVVLDESYGLQMRRVHEELEAISASRDHARDLKVRTGTPVLLLQDLIADGNDRPFEFSRIVFRGDKVRLSFDYSF
ncbi:GntR family transcriptional regulator [Actinotalea sp. M2MS4P-6]|uniref:GntR family transcriptional regulator n=1 Tax=Actinotalea sp. M2MS4P-6 TaxID=2983762 RepID=UPI0021E36BDC|nr:GntR family transcriptional regulator [Actinotalea sp. M2MS4P-6]MCV2395650.1 GntR family transcriptional regulator [Actinotalea sp. M2MS4P-6]